MVRLGDVGGEHVQPLDLDQKVHGFGLGVVLHVEGDDHVDERHDVLHAHLRAILGSLFLATVVLHSDLGG